MRIKIVGIFVCMLLIATVLPVSGNVDVESASMPLSSRNTRHMGGSGVILAISVENTPPNIPSDPHPEDGAIDIGVKTHLSWTGGDPDPGDKAVYDLYFENETNPGLVASDLKKPNYHPGVLEHNTSYYWYVVAKDENGASTTGPEWTFTTNNCTCDPPGQPSGPTRARNRTRYNYTTKIMNQSQNGWHYTFSWGDGNHTGWKGPYNHTERARAEHQWEEPGIYQVQTRARFMHGNRTTGEWILTGWSEPLLITVTADNPDNDPPLAPEISGQIQGKPGVEYEYTFTALDPDGDDLYYNVSWGCCGCKNHTYGPYLSGEEAKISHSWSEQGAYMICAKAVDVYGAEGPEGTLEVTMPVNYQNSQFQVEIIKNNVGNQFRQQILSRICGMLGICQGGCNLTNITGILEYDETNFFIGEVELHFGPKWYINTTQSPYDYDGDGVIETIFEELQGLVGTTVTMGGRLHSDDWLCVFYINGELYREPGKPGWAVQHNWRWRHRKSEP